MISVLIAVLIVCIVFGALWSLLTLIKLPSPFLEIARGLMALIFVIWLLFELLPFAERTIR